MYKLLFILTTIFLVSCSQQEATTVETNNSTLSNCVIVASHKKDRAFALACDQEETGKRTSKNKPVEMDYTPAIQQTCKVNFEDGKLEIIVCQDKYQSFKDYIKNGKYFNQLYECKGLNDSATLINDHDLVTAHFKEDGSYMFYYQPYELNTDSAWLVDEMVIRGTYDIIPPNKITVVPEELENGLTRELSYSFADAPSFLKDPKTITITNFGEVGFQGETVRFDQANNMYESYVNCNKKIF